MIESHPAQAAYFGLLSAPFTNKYPGASNKSARMRRWPVLARGALIELGSWQGHVPATPAWQHTQPLRYSTPMRIELSSTLAYDLPETSTTFLPSNRSALSVWVFEIFDEPTAPMVQRRFEGKKNGTYAIALSVIIMLLALGLFTLYYERGITGLILKRKTA